MTRTLSLLTDEVSPDLEAALRFAVEAGLESVDVRSIGGRNFLSLSRAEQQRIAWQIKQAGLVVGCLATPLLKWAAPGRASGPAGDQFGFDTRGRAPSALFDDAFAAAEILGTRNLRIFSLLAYPGFKLADLEADYAALIARAERLDMVLHVENEPVCNVASIEALADLVDAWRHPRLRALLDIGNATSVAQAPPSTGACVQVMPFVDLMHFKDWSRERRRVVALGQGDIPYSTILPACFAAAADRPLLLTIETHVPEDQPGATRRSLDQLRRLIKLA